jgi:amidophosphoribosyltransferase
MDILSSICRYCEGSYACVAMIPDIGMLAFRDPYGIKTLVYGRRMDPHGHWDYMCTSESIALDKLGFVDIRDVSPGA